MLTEQKVPFRRAASLLYAIQNIGIGIGINKPAPPLEAVGLVKQSYIRTPNTNY